MTGNPFYKTRVILSEELELKLAGKKDFDALAIAFKQALASSIARPTLNANYSIKALAGLSGGETYQDTDSKKRTNTGAPPGLVEVGDGIRYIKNQKWEPGFVLRISQSQIGKKKHSKEPNFGWVKMPERSTPSKYAEQLANKPRIRFRKYKVNQKTNEIIESTEQLIDQFSLNGKTTNRQESPEVKKLPGRPLSSRGSSLLHRAAGAFGVLVDELNKFRCPPGTPAANQFTDSMGSNCFGISPSELVNFAIDKAREMGDNNRFRNGVRSFFDFLSFWEFIWWALALASYSPKPNSSSTGKQMPLMLHLLFTLTQHSQKPWEKRISRWLENHFIS